MRPSLFLKGYTPTYTLKSCERSKNFSSDGPPVTDVPVAVLIDDGSFSASEIFAAVMQEFSRAVIVCQKSLGMLSAGEEHQLSYGTAMLVTVSQIYTAKGRALEKIGAMPDYAVDFKRDDIVNAKDVQLDKALEVLKEKLTK